MTKQLDPETIATAARAYAEGASLRELASSLNEMGYTGALGGIIHPYTLAIVLGNAGVKIRTNRRPEDIERVVIRMVRAGAKQVEIAKTIGRSQPSVSVMIRRMRAEGRL
jgi:DNA-binding NarL/FixJ family response regulator